MKNSFFIFIVSFVFFLSFSLSVSALSCDAPADAQNPNGALAHNEALHPNGQNLHEQLVQRNAQGQIIRRPLVPCGQFTDCRCEIADLFGLILRLYNFMVWQLMPILAAFAVVAGGVLIAISGLPGAAGWYDTGKRMIFGALLGVGIALISWLIVDLVLRFIGYSSAIPWNQINF